MKLAAPQHGLVTRGQLVAAGVSPDVVDRRLRSGWLQRVQQGVYRVGPVKAAHTREMAAVLACGASAVRSARIEDGAGVHALGGRVAFPAARSQGPLAEPAVKTTAEGYEVDFCWRDERLVIEVDGRRYHASDPSFEGDRLRDATLMAAGHRVMRVTWRQIVKEHEALLVRLTQALMQSARA